MTEIWKQVVGYEGLYEVSNKGRVKSKERTMLVKRAGRKPFLRKYGGEILRCNTNRCGYYNVSLSKNGKAKTHSVHRLVLTAFMKNPDNLPCINHKDEDKTNNNLENLEWCTVKYNNNYGTAIERSRIKTRRPVLQIKDGVVVKKWASGTEAGRNGYRQGCISLCCRGLQKNHKGFEWKYG